jgi:hypothetical protein
MSTFTYSERVVCLKNEGKTSLRIMFFNFQLGQIEFLALVTPTEMGRRLLVSGQNGHLWQLASKLAAANPMY